MKKKIQSLLRNIVEMLTLKATILAIYIAVIVLIPVLIVIGNIQRQLIILTESIQDNRPVVTPTPEPLETASPSASIKVATPSGKARPTIKPEASLSGEER